MDNFQGASFQDFVMAMTFAILMLSPIIVAVAVVWWMFKGFVRATSRSFERGRRDVMD